MVDDRALMGMRRLREEEPGILRWARWVYMPVGRAGGGVEEMAGNVHLSLQGEPRLLRNSDLGRDYL